LEADRSMRTLGFARVATQRRLVLRPAGPEALDAYAEGVNKFLVQHGESLPLEFVLLGYRPDRWTATDSIVVGKLQTFDASGNEAQEILRANIALRLGTAALDTLMPDPSGVSASAVDEHAWARARPPLSTSPAD